MYGKTSPSMRSHHGLYEVYLPVTDLDRAVDFYVEKLGFELGFGERGGPSALLLFSEGDTRWMLGLFRVDAVAHRHPPAPSRLRLTDFVVMKTSLRNGASAAP